MPMFGSQWLANAGASYEIDQSIRFNDDDNAYLIRTNTATPTSTTIWTCSFWVKRATLGTDQYILNAGPFNFADDFEGFYFLANDTLRVQLTRGNSQISDYRTNAVFRDPSAWYHFVIVRNGQSYVVYVNGVAQTFGTSTFGSNPASYVNAATPHEIGNRLDGYQDLDSYLAEFNCVDGQALAPTSFGETNDDGVWIPKAYDGSYGDNGFYITGATAGDLGEDFSGNNNDFTSSGLAAASQGADSPTLNYCTLTPLSIAAFTGTFSEGNLRLAVTANDMQFGTMFPQTGKWFFEVYVTDANNSYLGIIPETNANGEGNSLGYRNGAMLNTAGDIYIPSGAATEDGSPSWGDGVRVGVAYDVDNHLVWWSIDGQWYSANDSSDAAIAITEVEAGNQGYDFSGLGGNGFAPCIAASTTGGDCTLNTGNPTASFIDTTSNSDGNGYGLFADPVPSGFLALNTANLPTPAIADGSANFQTTLYTGNGTAIGSGGLAVSQSENSTFQPDFVWIKKRSGVIEHVLTDAVRGVTKELSSNDTGAEETVTEGLTTFGSAGFTVGSDGSYNTSSATYAGWQWLAGNGTASNEDGSINTIATSVNTTAGISISTYTGNATSGATIGHGLGVAPDVIIVKNRDAADAWQVYHSGVASDPATDYLVLNSIAPKVDNVNRWNDTAPTSSVFSLGNAVEVNTNTEDYVAYCFAEVEGFSKFGSYTGNGSTNGPFVWCGFKPAWVLIKRAVGGNENWQLQDSTLHPYNVIDDAIYADSAAAEVTNNSAFYTDFLSNGFKVRASHDGRNASGGTYTYMAFAENPFGGDGVAPATAR